MILNVHVAPKASSNSIKEEEGCLKVRLTQPAHDGLANAQLIDLLAKHFSIKKYQVRIIQGLRSRDKIVEINAD